MLQCWKAKPTLRPSFTELVQSIGDLLEESVKAVRESICNKIPVAACTVSHCRVY